MSKNCLIAAWVATKNTTRPYWSGPSHLASNIAVENAITALKTPAARLTLNLAEIDFELSNRANKIILL